MIDQSFRARISNAVTQALRPLPAVFAGCEGGSAAFGAIDAYSDIDLEYIVTDEAAFDDLYAVAERAIEAVSPIIASHTPPSGLGRYYKLKDGGDFLLIDRQSIARAVSCALSRGESTWAGLSDTLRMVSDRRPPRSPVSRRAGGVPTP
jgi:hypothetical protein